MFPKSLFYYALSEVTGYHTAENAVDKDIPARIRISLRW